MTPGESAAVVAMVAAAWPRQPMSDATVRVYEQMLIDLDVEVAKGAVRHLMTTLKFLPSIAEIREAAVTTRSGQVRLGMEAWGDVVEAIRKHGVYPSLMPWAQELAFADALVTECVRIMGWRELCLSENDAADRARFCELYDGLAKRARVGEVTVRQLPSAPGGLRHAMASGPGGRHAIGMGSTVGEAIEAAVAGLGKSIKR